VAHVSSSVARLSQLKCADVVLLNKADLVPPDRYVAPHSPLPQETHSDPETPKRTQERATLWAIVVMHHRTAQNLTESRVLTPRSSPPAGWTRWSVRWRV
jgi:G3E family GTPase